MWYYAGMEMRRDWLTTKEVADILGVSTGRVRQWLADGDLPSEKVGGVHLISRAAIEPFRHRKTTPGPQKGRPRATPRQEEQR
jgi:excisionase family DNA binding protein